MKKIVMLCCLLMWSMSLAFAETPREALVDRVKDAFLQHFVLPADSPMLEMWLDGARAKNRQTPEETWRAVKAKLAVALSKVLGQKGGMLDQVIKQATMALSDTELRHLVEILSDPVFVKYQQGMLRPDSQKQMLEGMLNSTFAMQAAMNEVLRQHSLNEVH